MEKNKRAIKKKSFHFTDYTESEFISQNKNYEKIKISLNRVTFLFFIFISIMLIFSIKIAYISLSPEKSIYSENIKKKFIKKRRDIVDRNGSILATKTSAAPFSFKNFVHGGVFESILQGSKFTYTVQSRGSLIAFRNAITSA